MRVIDLTHTITESMPVYPDTDSPRLLPANTYEENGFKETLISITSHTGTHADSPAHLYPDGRTLDDFPPEQFVGPALVIDCRDIPEGGVIDLARITKYGEKAEKVEFLLFNLGWDKHWGTPAYFGDYPCVDDAVLDYVLAGKYKGIGFDVIGLDPIADAGLPRHKKLLKSGDIINIENLKNLDLCGGELFNFGCFPLKITDADGAPVRAMAWFL